jgi:hypothetical protein
VQSSRAEAFAIDPQVMLRWSDDGGHTWSNSHWRSMGKTGAYGTRVLWRRLGMTLKLRDRVYEVSGTDQTKIAIMGAELIMSATNSGLMLIIAAVGVDHHPVVPVEFQETSSVAVALLA